MILTYIGIILALLASAVFLGALILFYEGKLVKTQRQLGRLIAVSLAAIGLAIVLCFVGTFVLK